MKLHTTHYKYEDTWIIGRHITEVEERYGEFDIGEYEAGKSDRVGYMVEDWFPVMRDPVPSYYYIEYNDEGVVTEVYIALHPGG